MKTSYHGSSKGGRNKLVYSVCKSCNTLKASTFGNAIEFIQMASNFENSKDILCGSSWTHARSIWPGRDTLTSLLLAPVASKHFSHMKFCFHDAVAGNCFWWYSYWSFGYTVQLVRKWVSQHEKTFPSRYSKISHDL